MEPPEEFMLLFNYQELDIKENAITLGWITENEVATCNTFILQGFTLSTIQSGYLMKPEFNITVVNGYTATIPSDKHVNSAGDRILYRLIAVDRDRTETACSNMELKRPSTDWMVRGMVDCNALL